ncbi:MAG TPA: nuclear transport factor 2 family protein [Mycobacteriales bacterium]|jgi:ketosteroid isomerase-like protein|nr:nuclear transport factor 2 family protein [Mycobacteriales bacterium]
MSDTEDVAASNQEFYAAIESGDLDRIEAMWDDADDVACVHPGWPAVRGRSRVLRSWAVIMANTAYIQFFPTGVEVAVVGDVGVVACEHSLLARTTDSEVGLGETARVVATNVFRRRADGWRLWAHHASPVMTATDDGELE